MEAATTRTGKDVEDKFNQIMDAWTQCLDWAKTGKVPTENEGK